MQESERIFIAENATLLRGSERELNRQLFTILNSIYDGLYITDGQANTILINRAYEEVSGLRREDVLGKSMQEIVATGMIDRSGSLGVLKTRKPVTLEQTFRTGKQALITSTPHFDSSGEITMIITVVRDMTEIYGLQRKYQESEERRRSEMEFLQRNQRFVSRMVAADPRTLEVLARAQKVATLDTTVLLLGETGVGKEQFARYIYENSARARQSFIGINCGAIPASLIESELFGYEKGAFTGASKEGKMGVFESADKGTVFLDEVGDLPLEMQVHLLRVLQEMQVRRVGGVRSISVDVRIIAATNRNLLDMVHEKTFREDLYYRLNVVPIEIPPLRERKRDIRPLVESFLKDMNKRSVTNSWPTVAARLTKLLFGMRKRERKWQTNNLSAVTVNTVKNSPTGRPVFSRSASPLSTTNGRFPRWCRPCSCVRPAWALSPCCKRSWAFRTV